MQYAYSRPLTKVIRSARSPQEGFALSGTVIVKDEGKGCCYVRFDETLVSKLGGKMPYGLGPGNEAYLKVVKKYDHFVVFCCYLDKSKTIALWREHTMPAWVKRIQRREVEIDET